jgi:hypothetical protein
MGPRPPVQGALRSPRPFRIAKTVHPCVLMARWQRDRKVAATQEADHKVATQEAILGGQEVAPVGQEVASVS